MFHKSQKHGFIELPVILKGHLTCDLQNFVFYYLFFNKLRLVVHEVKDKKKMWVRITSYILGKK